MERLIQEPDFAPPIVFLREAAIETPILDLDPNKEMPIPIRECKLCGYRDFDDKMKLHNCRRPN